MNAIKKLAPAERRKLERRLPLWEAAFKTADREDRKMLKEKIDNARRLLNMSPMVLAVGQKVKIKHTEIITERAPKFEKRYIKDGSPHLKTQDGKIISLEEILFNKNQLKLKDVEIVKKYNMCKTNFQKFKEKYILAYYVVKEDKTLSPTVYCNIKNETQMKDVDILRMYGLKSTSTFTGWKRDKIKQEYFPKKDIEFGSQDHIEAMEYCKILNKTKMTLKDLASANNMSAYMMSNLFNRLIEKRYCVINPLAITPELYCYEKNENRLTDLEIEDKYQLSRDSKIRVIKKKHIEIKFIEKY